MKSAEEVMEILAAFDLTGSLCDAAEMAGCSHHTVARYVVARDRGRAPGRPPAHRPGVIDPFLAKLEELVDRSHGKVRADFAHQTIAAMGYAGSERTTRRAVAQLKANRAAARVPAGVPEPGMWAQYDFGDGVALKLAAEGPEPCNLKAGCKLLLTIRTALTPGRTGRWQARLSARSGHEAKVCHTPQASAQIGRYLESSLSTPRLTRTSTALTCS